MLLEPVRVPGLIYRRQSERAWYGTVRPLNKESRDEND